MSDFVDYSWLILIRKADCANLDRRLAGVRDRWDNIRSI